MTSSPSQETRSILGPISIRESFQHALPSYPYNPVHDGAHNAGSSGQHTAATTAPKFAIPRQGKTWASIGKEFLDEINTMTEKLKVKLHEKGKDAAGNMVPIISDETQRKQLEEVVEIANSFLEGEHLVPQREGNIKQVNEADVVRCATLYLVHPVVQAFWAHPKYSKSLLSQSEHTKEWSRTDLTFYKTKQGNTNRAFLILEYKRRTVIKRAEFEHRYDMPRSWRPPGTRTQAMDKLNELILLPFEDSNHSGAIDALKEVVKFNKFKMDSPGIPASNLFKSGGSLNLIKQASAYAIEHSTRYVALFNYDYLVLCYFPWLDHTKQGGWRGTRDHYKSESVQYPVEVEVVPAEDSQVRLALLGFMRTAYDETPYI